MPPIKSTQLAAKSVSEVLAAKVLVLAAASTVLVSLRQESCAGEVNVVAGRRASEREGRRLNATAIGQAGLASGPSGGSV